MWGARLIAFQLGFKRDMPFGLNRSMVLRSLQLNFSLTLEFSALVIPVSNTCSD